MKKKWDFFDWFSHDVCWSVRDISWSLFLFSREVLPPVVPTLQQSADDPVHTLYHHPVVRRISDSVTHAEARLLWRNSKISVIFKKKTNNEKWHKSEVISYQKHSNLELKGKFSWMVFVTLVFGFDWFVVKKISHFGRENSNITNWRKSWRNFLS